MNPNGADGLGGVLFQVEAKKSGHPDVIGNEVFLKDNTYRSDLEITKSGVWTISATYNGKAILGTEEINIAPGYIEFSKSIVDCVTIIPAMSVAECSIQARDSYENVIPSSARVANMFLGKIEFQVGSRIIQNHAFNPRVVLGSGNGEYLLRYRSPSRQSSLTVNIFSRYESSNGEVVISHLPQASLM